MSDKNSKRMRSECRWVLLCGFADECICCEEGPGSLHFSQYVTVMHEKNMACFEHTQHQTTNYTITWGTQPHFDAEEQRGDIEAVPIIATRLRSTHTLQQLKPQRQVSTMVSTSRLPFELLCAQVNTKSNIAQVAAIWSHVVHCWSKSS